MQHFIYSNNKIINNNNTKNNSIKVYSSRKNLPKIMEEEKINIQSQKKGEKKPFTTDTNVQLISINHNNIIRNNIDNNYLLNSSSNNNKIPKMILVKRN